MPARLQERPNRAGVQGVCHLPACCVLHNASPQAAWGADHMRPKHHYLWHNALQAARGVSMDCFVHERKHQLAKQAWSLLVLFVSCWGRWPVSLS